MKILEIKEFNRTYTFSKCKCGGLLVNHSFMVPDGHDDVDWDFDEWCEKEHPSGRKGIGGFTFEDISRIINLKEGKR